MKRLLIVEDDPNLGILYREEFREDGFDVTLVTSGEKAVEVFRAERFACVILDLRLGDTSGLDVLRALLEDRADIPVVINSAYSSFKADFASWSADRYVVKSSDIGPLKEAVWTVLAARAA